MSRSGLRSTLRGGAVLLASLAASVAAHGQTATLFGSLANFDVLNDTGQDAHGFEVEIQGATLAQITYTFGSTRYGGSTARLTPGGAAIARWAATYDPAAQRWSATTVTPAVFQPTYGHSCVLTFVVGCDHFGLASLYYSPLANTAAYYWLVEDANNPGQLIRYGGPRVQIPQPTVTVIPPAQVGNPPQVVFEIVVPPPPPPEVPKPVAQFGDAKWVKVYKTEVQKAVALEDLLADNPIVPQDPAHQETAWKLLQFNPNTHGNSGVLRNQGGLGSGNKAVVRRYEFYKYSGVYNALDHSATCGGDGLCNAPLDGELGDFIGAQNAAANVGVPSITVTKVGSGTVTGANGKINCGGSCTATQAQGTVVTLTANPGGGIFTGWSGDCAGASLTCNVTVNAEQNVTANFASQFSLSIGRSGSGTVVATPNGNDRQLNCGGACSAKFTAGTSVTVSATPAAGLSFVGWSNGCVGTAPTCTFAISKDTTVQATFK
jgi:Divergent InlB B-repeat domain